MPLRVKDWPKFQHYKHRNPLWIKLYRSWLDDADFQCLPVASRALAPMLWLIASESLDGVIKDASRSLAWRLRQSESEFLDSLKPLIEKGFFIVEQDASNPLAERYKDDSEVHAKCLLREEKSRDREEKETEGDSENLIFKIWKTYPTNKHRQDELTIPRIDNEAILDALAQDGEKVLAGVGAYRQATDSWPTEERKFIRSLPAFMQARDYLKDPAEWHQKPTPATEKSQPKIGYKKLTREDHEKQVAASFGMSVEEYKADMAKRKVQ